MHVQGVSIRKVAKITGELCGFETGIDDQTRSVDKVLRLVDLSQFGIKRL